MKYCKKLIIEKIQQQINDMSGDKLILRIENFENARFYLEIYKQCQELCQQSNIDFTAKLTLGAWESLKRKNGADYDIGELERLGVVDKKNRITFYRNEMVDGPKLVLFLGTEYAEDKAGLNELFLLNPKVLEHKIKNQYSMLFEKYYEIIGETDRKRLDHFYEELFRYVPKNLMHLSSIVDEMPQDVETFEDMMELIFSRLYEDWGLPGFSGFPVSQIKEKGKIPVLDKADQFVRRNKLRTAGEIKKACEKIDKYKQENPGIENTWQNTQGFSSFEEFEQSLREYISGKNISENRERLCKMNFLFINEILDLKITREKKDNQKESRIRLYGEPFLMLEKALLLTLGDARECEVTKMVMEVESIKLAGIYGEQEEEDTRHSEELYWSRICRYCGGLIPYINEKGYLGREKDCKIVLETDIFRGENIAKLIEDGLLTPLGGNHVLSKMRFQIVAMAQETEIGRNKFEWVFSEKEGWINYFVELENEFFAQGESGSYIPFGVLGDIDHYRKIQSEEEFYHSFARREITYQNLVEEFMRKYGEDYPEITKEYETLGEQFLALAGEICQKGFYQVLLEQEVLQTFLETYCKMGNLLADIHADDCLVESYRLFVNAFLLAGNEDCVKKDLEVESCVIPAYHPAALEKIKERISFITDGMQVLYRECFEKEIFSEKEIDKKIQLYHQLSYINSSVDLLSGKDKSLICQNMFGGYGVYSDVPFEKIYKKGMGHQRLEYTHDENLDKKGFSALTPEAKVIIRYIKDYIRTFPSSTGTLDIGMIHYEDLQSVAAAMYHLTKEKDVEMENINLHIFMPQGKIGRENVLSYWLEECFEEECFVKFQIFLRYYREEKELQRKMEHLSLDIVFLHHVLTNQEVSFSGLIAETWQEDVKFPMLYKPLPMYYKSAKREVEISQLQFPVSQVHTKVMYKLINKEKRVGAVFPRLVKTARIQEEKIALMEQLHQSAKWVVCQDMGLDKHILFRQEKGGTQYKIIGFSTGEGTFGEYNVLVSAREEMVEDLKQRVKRKLNSTFGKWREEQLEEAAAHCVDIAKELNGSSLLKALNPEDEDIRNFLAYVLTTEYHKKQGKTEKTECEIMISLDSYKHWFREQGEEGGKLESYPDFLQLSVTREERDENQNIRILAKMIECKLAFEKEKHVEKAKCQIQCGYEILKKKFNPNSVLPERKYWFAQLYQVLVFEQINRANNEDVFLKLASDLLGILNGNFTIDWEGEIYTFWINRDSQKEEIVELSDIRLLPTKQVIFGQQEIKALLAGSTREDMTSFEVVPDEEEMEEKREMEEPGKEEPIGKQNPVSEVVNEQTEESDRKKTEKISQESGAGICQKIEIFLGTSKLSGEKISWNYTNKDMANRHLLITGKSGQGKTYAIQSFLLEFAKAGIPAIIFDYTEGFTNKKLDKTFREQLQGKIRQNFVKINRMPINPFLRQEIDIHEIMDEEDLAGMTPENIRAHSKEDSVAVASRIASILCHVYSFGDQQSAAIYQACKTGIDTYGEDMNFQKFRRLLEDMNTKEAKTVRNKLTPFLDTNLFAEKGSMDWSEMLYNDGEINVIQLTQIPRDMQIVATEFILWDMWYYSLLHGEEGRPFIVVLDEAQNLDFGEKSPSNKILTEGRKFGWSGWFATQFLKGQLKEDEIGRLQQTSQRMYFRPPDNEITSMAASIVQDRTRVAEWVNKLKKLQKGNCIVTGDSLFGEHGQKLVPLQIVVSSMEERVEDNG